jgi:hypothetical protein
MNQSFLFFRLLFFFFSTFLTPLLTYSNVCDTIKPLPRINKEFLVIAYIVVDKDSVPNITQAQITSTLANVSQIFAPIGASFTVCEFRTIYNFQYNAVDSPFKKELDPQYKSDNRINIYYVDNFKGDLGTACGVAAGGIPGTNGNITIKKSCNQPLVVAHEMGHYFSLLHPFNGGTELVNGSNCQTDGDGVCDTPADPFVQGDNLSDYVNSSCLFISTKKDANGEYYDPDVSNIMSYYTPCVCLKFTHQQYERMANYYLSNPTAW